MDVQLRITFDQGFKHHTETVEAVTDMGNFYILSFADAKGTAKLAPNVQGIH